MTDNRDDMDFREVTDDESVDIKDDFKGKESAVDGNDAGDKSDDAGSGADKTGDDNPNISSARREDYEDVCFVCRRPESKAGKMFHLPNNISICDDCMHKTMDAVSQFDYQNLLNIPSLMNELN